jgi:hypothetical protein
MAKVKRKIFVVSEPSGKHLVRALTVAGAIAHVVRTTFEARVATQDDLVFLAPDHPVEEAAAPS